MVCWMIYVNLVKQLTGVSEKDAIDILRDIEEEVGHNKELIKAVVDAEGPNLIKRLKRKKHKKKNIAYA
ncbi:MAG: hypothetical protein J7K68_00505 [Candidatus Diapherotrites archaeon]|nr:hypothetical protein [Candidatus Diapherotrites archaeon]